jgi:hypothetical protein
MLALPVPPFTLQKCYRELIRRVLKEAHKRWKHRNTQLLQSRDLVDHAWIPSTRTFKVPPTSPRKRKRDIQWSATRLTETRMQHILHDYTHTQHLSPSQCTTHTDTDPGEDSGVIKHIEEVGILEGGAEDPLASAIASPVVPSRTGKRRRDTVVTQIDRQRRSSRLFQRR